MRSGSTAVTRAAGAGARVADAGEAGCGSCTLTICDVGWTKDTPTLPFVTQTRACRIWALHLAEAPLATSQSLARNTVWRPDREVPACPVTGSQMIDSSRSCGQSAIPTVALRLACSVSVASTVLASAATAMRASIATWAWHVTTVGPRTGKRRRSVSGATRGAVLRKPAESATIRIDYAPTRWARPLRVASFGAV